HGLRWPQTDDFQRPLGGIGDLGAKAAESAVSRSSSTTRTRDRLAGPSNIDMIHPPAGRAWGRPTKDKTANTTGIRRAARGKFNKCPKTGFVARNEDLGDELRALSPFRTGSKKLSGAQGGTRCTRLQVHQVMNVAPDGGVREGRRRRQNQHRHPRGG